MSRQTMRLMNQYWMMVLIAGWLTASPIAIAEIAQTPGDVIEGQLLAREFLDLNGQLACIELVRYFNDGERGLVNAVLVQWSRGEFGTCFSDFDRDGTEMMGEEYDIHFDRLNSMIDSFTQDLLKTSLENQYLWSKKFGPIEELYFYAPMMGPFDVAK